MSKGPSFVGRRNALIVVCFCDAVCGGILFPVIPFRFQDLGATPMEVALLLAITPVASAFVAPVIGAWSDRTGRIVPLIAAAAISAATFAAYAFAAQIWELVIIRLFGSFCNTTTALAHAFACDISNDRETRSDTFRYLAATTPAGFIIGPLLAALAEPVGPAAPFLLGCVISLIPVVTCLLFLRNAPTQPLHLAEDAGRHPLPLREIWSIGRKICTSTPILIALSLIVLGTLARTAWSTTGGMYLTEAAPRTMTKQGFSVFVTLSAVVEFAAVIWLFPIFRKLLSDLGAIAAGAIGFTIGLAVVMQSQEFWAIAVAVVGIGFGLSFLRPATRNVLAEHSQPGTHGSLMAFSEAAAFGSKTIATVLAGLLFSWSAILPLTVSAVGHVVVFVLILAAFATGLLAFRSRSGAQEQGPQTKGDRSLYD